jgi:hypothetical protein
MSYALISGDIKDLATEKYWKLRMLRVDFHETANAMTMQLEGKLVGRFAEEARTALLDCCKVPQRLIVDLSEVIFVDSIGEELLVWLGKIGGQFVAESCYPVNICERLHLPIVAKLSDPPPDNVLAFADHFELRLDGRTSAERRRLCQNGISFWRKSIDLFM